MKKSLITLGASAALALSAQAQTTLFDQSFTELAGNQPSIDGAAVGNANTVAGVSANWASEATSAGILRTDGHVFTLVGSAYVGLGSIISDAEGQSDGVFTLTTVMAAPGNTPWVSTGFFQAADVTQTFVDAGGIGSALYRTTGNLDFFAGPGTGGTAYAEEAATGNQTLISVLDVSSYNGTTDFGTISYYVGSVAPGNLEYTYDYLAGDGVDFTTMAAGISTQGGGGEGTILSISLTQAVPEPSAYALLAGCLALTWVMIRRRA